MSQSPPAASSSPIYQSVFESALEAYKKTTKTDLASHHLLIKLESCDLSEAILTTLRGQITDPPICSGSEWRRVAWFDCECALCLLLDRWWGRWHGTSSLADFVYNCHPDPYSERRSKTYLPAAVILTGIYALLSVSLITEGLLLTRRVTPLSRAECAPDSWGAARNVRRDV